MNPIVVIGGAGTFGTHVCRELARQGWGITVAGRDGERAAAFASTLGGNHDSAQVDLNRRDSLSLLLRGRRVAVHCAGPFQSFDASFLDACLVAGCHSVDIADDRRYVAAVRAARPRFLERGLTAAYGCSSLPALSGALAQVLMDDRPDERPTTWRVTLFIGNDNPKGVAAISSMLSTLGQPIETPSGPRRGFRDREVSPLPAPFGSRGVYNFESPDLDLLVERYGPAEVRVKLGFELALATEMLALLARTGLRLGARTARMLAWSGRPFRRWGCSGGVVQVEAWHRDGHHRRAAVVARTEGQRMAALPAAFAAAALARGEIHLPGAHSGDQFLGARALLQLMNLAGFPTISDPTLTGLSPAPV